MVRLVKFSYLEKVRTAVVINDAKFFFSFSKPPQFLPSLRTSRKFYLWFSRFSYCLFVLKLRCKPFNNIMVPHCLLLLRYIYGSVLNLEFANLFCFGIFLFMLEHDVFTNVITLNSAVSLRSSITVSLSLLCIY